MKQHIMDHTHGIDDYRHDIPRRTLILRLTPDKFKDFLSAPPQNIVWPLTIFDEFTAHCGSMGVEAKPPTCKLFWAISATPNTITEVFTGKSKQNPFKKMLSDRFSAAETVPFEKKPLHFGVTLDERKRILESNLMVSLITAFPPALIRRTIHNVIHLMPPTVHYIASHATARTADVALGRWRPAPKPVLKGDTASVSSEKEDGVAKITVADFTVDPPNTHHTFSCYDRDYAPTHLGDFRLPSNYPAIRWRQPESIHKLVPTKDLLQDLDKAFRLFEKHPSGIREEDRSTAQAWFRNTEHALQTPTFPSEVSNGHLAACTRCCCVIDILGLRSHFWFSHHYDHDHRRIRCPGCFHFLDTSSVATFGVDSEMLDIAVASRESLEKLRDGTSYAAALYATLYDAITYHDARSIVIFADAARGAPFIKDICGALALHTQVACRRLTDRIYAANIKQSTAAGKKDAVVSWYQQPYRQRQPLECRVLILDAAASQKGEEVCGLNFQDTDRMIVCNVRVSDAQQALARALRAKQTDHPRPPLTLNIFCDAPRFEATYCPTQLHLPSPTIIDECWGTTITQDDAGEFFD
ncbi:hypothetical protein CYMTET_8255 [Cymbomonas tetramitiformis]|uniref:Uncharacterized protein n=1 Tax=Cymbomonas tetramitiformis TaxID=36881 RepID=A0AAE0GTJ5_9CHLO|nr:hypothetical protein CYMTET_8255 [Cymbomonas tetramitiformis]